MTPPVPRAGGILNVAKPSGPTSHDVVNRVRRLLGVRRVGHSGTLDPLAEGVLLVGVGAATRLLEYLHDLPKRYRAGLRFGEVTDTHDVTGTVLSTSDASPLKAAAVEAALPAFRGEIFQVPPMFSAVKVGGERLYERARRGEVVERAARRVTIHEIALHDFRHIQPLAGYLPRAEAVLDILCSSGTYVRTLCHDLGQALGTGATMTELTRTAIGSFTLAAAVPLDELARRVSEGEPLPWISPAEAVAHLPTVTVDSARAAALRQGKWVVLSNVVAAPRARILDPDGQLVAIGRTGAEEQDSDGCLAPEKVFPPADADP